MSQTEKFQTENSETETYWDWNFSEWKLPDWKILRLKHLETEISKNETVKNETAWLKRSECLEVQPERSHEVNLMRCHFAKYRLELAFEYSIWWISNLSGKFYYFQL